MDKFTTLTGTAAPLPTTNVDTDQIIPKQFLKTIGRTGLGKSLFFDARYDDKGREVPAFLLNRKPFRDAKILVAGENFGCGSSREHAPWALLDFGIRSAIAPSFADIFYNNCLKNGFLPVRLPKDQVARLLEAAEKKAPLALTVDLERQRVTGPDGIDFRFEIDPTHRDYLLNGLDDIALTLEKAAKIDAFEKEQKSRQPWLSR